MLFFISFCKKTIRVVCAIFVITIKDLEKRVNNSNLLIRKSAIGFELWAQKRETGRQTADALYYKY